MGAMERRVTQPVVGGEVSIRAPVMGAIVADDIPEEVMQFQSAPP